MLKYSDESVPIEQKSTNISFDPKMKKNLNLQQTAKKYMNMESELNKKLDNENGNKDENSIAFYPSENKNAELKFNKMSNKFIVENISDIHDLSLATYEQLGISNKDLDELFISTAYTYKFQILTNLFTF